MLLSVIIPCYNEEDNINPFFDEMEKVRHRIQDDTDLELVFVDDGSSDRTFDLIYALSKAHPFVKYVRFSRNFGKNLIANHQYSVESAGTGGINGTTC